MKEVKTGTQTRELKEVSLEEPIRYGSNDPIENWLNDLLCLNCSDGDMMLA